MKFSLLVFFIMTTFQFTWLEVGDVPEKVKLLFEEMYPGSEDVYWDEWDDIFAVSFLHEGYFKVAYFDLEGDWQETVTQMESEDLSERIRDYIESLYEIDEYNGVSRIEKLDVMEYHVHISILGNEASGGENEEEDFSDSLTVVFSEQGDFIRVDE